MTRALLPAPALAVLTSSTIVSRQVFAEALSIGSTDAADVSWVVPSGWFLTATYVPGPAGHTRQATACSGGSIGRKGMMVAARVSFEQALGGRDYRSRIPADAMPPLDYRDSR